MFSILIPEALLLHAVARWQTNYVFGVHTKPMLKLKLYNDVAGLARRQDSLVPPVPTGYSMQACTIISFRISYDTSCTTMLCWVFLRCQLRSRQ